MIDKFRAAPLSSSFFGVSIIGTLAILLFWGKVPIINARVDPSWHFAFLLVFIAMFIASFISMQKAPIDAEIAIDLPREKRARMVSKDSAVKPKEKAKK